MSEKEFIDREEIQEVVEANDNGAEPMSEDEEADDQNAVVPAEGDEENLEIDMSNNSVSYFDAHEDSVFCVAAHPSLPLIFSGGGDNMGYLWSYDEYPAAVVSVLSGHTESVIAGGFTSDGKYLVSGDMTGQIRIWKNADGSGTSWSFYSKCQEVSEVVWIKFHPKAPIFAMGAVDGSVWVYGLEPKLELLGALYSHSMATNTGLFVNTDKDASTELSLMTISDDSSIILWNVYTQSAIYTLLPEQLNGEHAWISMCASPSGSTVAVGGSDGILAILRVDNGQLLNYIDTCANDPEDMDMADKSIEGLAWSGNILALGNVAGSIKLYEVGSWKIRKVLQFKDSVTKLAFASPTILVGSCQDGALTAWDVRNGEIKWEGKGHSAGVMDFSLKDEDASVGGKTLVTAGDEGVCLVFNAQM